MSVKKPLKSNGQGYYYRNLGWAWDKSGTKLSQPKFMLGTDRRQASDRIGGLERLWELVKRRHEAQGFDGKPRWHAVTLAVGKAIARGEHVFRLGHPSADRRGGEDQDWADADYASYLQEMQVNYPVITFIPGDEEAFQNGLRKSIEIARNHEPSPPHGPTPQPGHEEATETLNNSEMLHFSIREYAESIDTNPKYQNHATTPGSLKLTGWGCKVKDIALDFIRRYEDRPLHELATLESVQSLFDYWRSRPKHLQTGKPITPKTAKHRMTVLSMFLKRLNNSSEFTWRKPIDFGDIEKSVNHTLEEKTARARVDQVKTWTEHELAVLYRNTTTPLERVLMLLALNCACKESEAGTLCIGDMYLDQPHPHADLPARKSALHGRGEETGNNQMGGWSCQFWCRPRLGSNGMGD